MTTKIAQPRPFVEILNQFSFDLYAINGANLKSNIAFSPITLFNLLNRIRSCSDDSTRRLLNNLLNLNDTDDDDYLAQLPNFKELNSFESELIVPKGLLKPSYVERLNRLNKHEKELIIVENTSKLIEKLEKLDLKIKNESSYQSTALLTSKFELNLEWRTEFSGLTEKGVLKGPCRNKEIKLMKIPKRL